MKIMTIDSPKETMELASRVAKRLHKGDLVALIGELGTGKTMFVKGLARGLGVKDYAYVNSPSFVVLKEYHGKKNLYHFDIYRLEAESFFETVDYEKYFYNDGITAVEWADKIKEALPENYLEVSIEYEGASSRKFTLRSVGDKFTNLLDKI